MAEGDASALPSASESAEMLKAQRGRYSDVKLLKLIGHDDSGTAEDPLRSFSSLSAEVASARFTEALWKLQSVSVWVHTQRAGPIMVFFSKLHKAIAAWLRGGTPWPALSKFGGRLWRDFGMDLAMIWLTCGHQANQAPRQ